MTYKWAKRHKILLVGTSWRKFRYVLAEIFDGSLHDPDRLNVLKFDAGIKHEVQKLIDHVESAYPKCLKCLMLEKYRMFEMFKMFETLTTQG
jgi:hypothetical protein